MFKQTSQTKETLVMSSTITDKSNAISAKQLSEFSKLTGRSDAGFKIGKVTDVSSGK